MWRSGTGLRWSGTGEVADEVYVAVSVVHATILVASHAKSASSATQVQPPPQLPLRRRCSSSTASHRMSTRALKRRWDAPLP